MTPDKLTCKEAVELVTEYLEESLLAEMETGFNQHLDSCPGCTIYVDQMRQTLRTLRRLTDEATPAEEKVQLLQLFQAWHNHQSGEQPAEALE